MSKQAPRQIGHLITLASVYLQDTGRKRGLRSRELRTEQVCGKTFHGLFNYTKQPRSKCCWAGFLATVPLWAETPQITTCPIMCTTENQLIVTNASHSLSSHELRIFPAVGSHYVTVAFNLATVRPEDITVLKISSRTPGYYHSILSPGVRSEVLLHSEVATAATYSPDWNKTLPQTQVSW